MSTCFTDSSVRCGQAPCGLCDGHTTQQPRIRQSVQGAQALAKASAAAGAITLSSWGGGQRSARQVVRAWTPNTASQQESYVCWHRVLFRGLLLLFSSFF